MLNASEGDCFLLEFFTLQENINILIDTGPVVCWENELKTILDHFISEKKRINVLIITHIDSDHIGGALKLFQEKCYSDIIDDVWFNGLKQLLINSDTSASERENRAFRKLNELHWHDTSNLNGPISANQAVSLSTMLAKCSQSVNSINKGLPITDETGTIELGPGLFVDFLLPRIDRLEKLKEKFHIALNQVMLGTLLAITPDGEAAFENLMLDEDTGFEHIEHISRTNPNIADIKIWAEKEAKKDSSATNASSIAICIRFLGNKLLFPGDANEDDLLPALDIWQRKLDENLFFDVIKLPHHGSGSNCLQLLSKIDGRFFLVSTDGRKFSHPSKETIAKIVTRPTNKKRHLIFNYENDMFNLFCGDLEDKYSYSIKVQKCLNYIGGEYT